MTISYYITRWWTIPLDPTRKCPSSSSHNIINLKSKIRCALCVIPFKKPLPHFSVSCFQTRNTHSFQHFFRWFFWSLSVFICNAKFMTNRICRLDFRKKKIIFYCYPWFKSIPNFTEVTFGLCCGRNKKKYVQLWSSKNGKNRRVSCCWIFHNLYSLKFERPENVDFHHHLNFSKRDFSFCRWYFAFLFFEVM